MSTDITAAPQAGKLREWIDRPAINDQLKAAVGDWMKVDTFIAHAMVSFQDEKVRRCTDKSKYKALFELAAMTLLPTLGQVVLIPYKDEIKATVQWQGMKALMERNPDILEVTAVLVHTGDDFEIFNGDMRHGYDPLDPERTIEKHTDIRGGYCRITYRDGRPPKFHFVPVRTIVKASKCAQTQKIWSAWYEQMALKTLYRDCFARRAVPMDPLVYTRLKKAFDIEDLNLGNDPARVTTEATERHIEQAKQQRVDAPPPDQQAEEVREYTPPKDIIPESTKETTADTDDILGDIGITMEEAKTESAVNKIEKKALADQRIAEHHEFVSNACERRREAIRASKQKATNEANDLFPDNQ